MDTTEILISKIKAIFQKKGYAFFEKGDYNLNIIAIREDDWFDNRFSDTLLVIYKVKDIWQVLQIKWTTLAGTYGLGGEQSPLTKWQTGTDLDGVAIIAEGQHRGAFEYRDDGTVYPFTEYLEQVKGLPYWRDNNKNWKVDRDPSTYRIGNYKTHIHAMSPKGSDADLVSFIGYLPWSQGCQGSPWVHFYKFLLLIRMAVRYWGKRFTYTIIHRRDFQ